MFVFFSVDVELAREKGYDSEKYYVRECERQLLLPNKHVQYFDAKGTRIIEMTSISCQYDGNFAQKQCDQSVCMCTNLKGVTLKSYRKDKSSDTSSMRCNCARQVSTVYSSLQFWWESRHLKERT